jgi:hypothetical protein
MATWMQFYEYLMDRALTGAEAAALLRVRPSRLRQMLRSRRLTDFLLLTVALAKMQGDRARLSAAELAAEKLLAMRQCYDCAGGEGNDRPAGDRGPTGDDGPDEAEGASPAEGAGNE